MNYISIVPQIVPNLRSPVAMVPSVYEMAAVTQDLDTQTVTTRIKELLLTNNIGQKVSTEAVSRNLKQLAMKCI